MLYSIQYLRGVAALLVVLHHISHKGRQYDVSSLNGLNIGNSGVDLFFIISGFIMCYTTHNKNILFSEFIKLRFQRILPLYWLFTTLALVVYWVAPQYINSSGGETGILASYLLLPTGERYLVNNGWTLSYEFYFYFIFSLFILFNSNSYNRYLNISLTIVSLFLVDLWVNSSVYWVKFLFNDLLIEFVLGMVSFMLYQQYKFNSQFSLGLVISAVVLLTYQNFYGSLFSGAFSFAIPMFLLFNGFLHLEHWFKDQKNIFSAGLEKLGGSSYSLYLIHPFVLAPMAIIYSKLGIENADLFTWILLIPSVLAGWITYRKIETPLTKMFSKKKPKKEVVLETTYN